MRTFWDLQQNQEKHKETDWQDKMVEIEMRVSDLKEYKDIAFFHHLVIKKDKIYKVKNNYHKMGDEK